MIGPKVVEGGVVFAGGSGGKHLFGCGGIAAIVQFSQGGEALPAVGMVEQREKLGGTALGQIELG